MELDIHFKCITENINLSEKLKSNKNPIQKKENYKHISFYYIIITKIQK